MLDGPSVVAAFEECGVSHVIWIPDSELGTWDKALCSAAGFQLIRVCREGEAMALAAGLLVGGKQPVVVIQCTGLFEAGDSLRNFVHDLKLPLFLVIGLRGYHAYQRRTTADTCPIFAEPILRAWQIPYVLFEGNQTGQDLAKAYRQAWENRTPSAILVPE